MTRNIKRQRQGGFTLIELMIVVAIIGILAIIAIPAYMRYIAHSKTSEAKNQISAIYKGVDQYYATHGKLPNAADGSAAQDTTVVKYTNNCCATGGTDEKCKPDPTQWQLAAGATGAPPVWQPINYALNDPTYYKFTLAVTQPTGANADFTVTANGDLDCDGTPSTFIEEGKAATGGTGLTRQPLQEIQPDE